MKGEWGNLNPVLKYIVITMFIGLFSSFLIVGIFNLVTVSGIVGKRKTINSVILEMNRGKHSYFKMGDSSGKTQRLIPRDSDFPRYKIGDTLKITFNIFNPNEAYVGNNRHIIYGNIFGLLLFSIVSASVYLVKKRELDIKKFKNKNYLESQ